MLDQPWKKVWPQRLLVLLLDVANRRVGRPVRGGRIKASAVFLDAFWAYPVLGAGESLFPVANRPELIRLLVAPLAWGHRRGW